MGFLTYNVKRNSYDTNEFLHGFSSFYLIPLKSIICREILRVSTKYITKFHKLFILGGGAKRSMILINFDNFRGGGGWLIICHCFFFYINSNSKAYVKLWIPMLFLSSREHTVPIDFFYERIQRWEWVRGILNFVTPL